MIAHREAGFTLIELMISLALFGLIAIAGLSLVDGVLGIQSRTEGRLERLAELRRAMFLVGSDIEQVAPGPVAGGGDGIVFSRTGAGRAGIAAPVRYALVGGTLSRIVPQTGAQQVLTHVGAARWRFYAASSGWVDRWPPLPELAQSRPRAVELTLTLMPGRGAAGTLRRVVALPAQP